MYLYIQFDDKNTWTIGISTTTITIIIIITTTTTIIIIITIATITNAMTILL